MERLFSRHAELLYVRTTVYPAKGNEGLRATVRLSINSNQPCESFRAWVHYCPGLGCFRSTPAIACAIDIILCVLTKTWIAVDSKTFGLQNATRLAILSDGCPT